MLKMNSLAAMSTGSSVPESAFTPIKTLEVPEAAFGKKSSEYGKYAAYVKYSRNKTTGREYAAFVFVKSTLQRYFKDFSEKHRYEFVQGNAPHKDWFVIRKATTQRGNKLVQHGLIFYSRTIISANKMNLTARYPLELVSKDGCLYAKLPPELVSLLR